MTKIKLAYGKAALSRVSSIVFLLAVLLVTLIDGRTSLAQSLPSSGAQQSNASNPDCEHATGSPSIRPDFHLDRSEEDWSGLCDRAMRGGDPWDRVKYVTLGRSSYASFGGELRSSYELYRNYNWGSGPQTRTGYYLNRLIGHADLHFGKRLRLFGELQSGLEFGREGGPRPAVDEDKLDFSQLFFELNASTHNDKASMSVRIGRQELNFGDGTLVSTREVNVRRPFDGIKLVLQPREWHIEVFAVKPVATQSHLFDDAPDHRQTFWGVWATRPNALPFFKQLDLYYLGLDRNGAQFNQGAARERRHTLGFNTSEAAGPVTLAQEGDFQIGSFGSGRIVAWKFAQGVSYSFPRTRYQPVFGLQGAISSGDGDPRNTDLQTFYPLFPKGLYYGYMLFTSGSLNAIVAHPSLGIQLSRTLSLNLDSFFLWRQNRGDGLYSQSGMFLRSGQVSQGRSVGATQDLSIAWRMDKHATLRFLAAYYETGPYLSSTQPRTKNTSYFAVTASYRF